MTFCNFDPLIPSNNGNINKVDATPKIFQKNITRLIDNDKMAFLKKNPDNFQPKAIPHIYAYIISSRIGPT